MRTTTLTFEEFRGLAMGQNLNNVTEEEYQTHYLDKTQLSAGGAIRTIRSYRRRGGEDGEYEEEVIIGWALGSRQFTSQRVPITESKSQLVTILTPDGLREVITRGNWNGQHGRKVEVELRRKIGKSFWGIKRTSVFEDKWRHQEAQWRDLAELAGFELPTNADGYNIYHQHMIRGVVATIFPEKNWDAQKDIDTGRTPQTPHEEDEEGRVNWPVSGMGEGEGWRQGPPTAAVYQDAPGVTLSAHFGPWKQAAPLLLGMEDWLPDLDVPDLAASHEGLPVGVVGTITKSTNDVKDGEDITRLHMQASALVLLDPSAPASSAPAAARPAAQPTAPAQSEVMDQVQALLDSVQKGLMIQRQGASVASLKQAGYVDANTDDNLVQMALDQLRSMGVGSGTPVPAPTPAPDPSPTSEPAGGTETVQPDEAMLQRFHRLIALDDTAGDGVSIDHLVLEGSKFGVVEAEVIACVDKLLDEGSIYEHSPSMMRVTQ